MASLDQIDKIEEELMPTRDLGSMAANLSSSDLSENAISWAKHCILDWIAVTVGGAHDELTKKIISVALDEEAIGKARIVGHETKLVASQAALVKYSISLKLAGALYLSL